ncbi:hypothetical protein PHISCL_02080 [Aspergillus sclerotialis]|uniref:Transcription factor n=1 Tax=Aspergillus sclerotialis TaxID=2070753 RepID=A0A3A2ZTG4_9EURO|nr:hypothetical protein PHISCL_02080 [Aspergillus sclerotialis]
MTSPNHDKQLPLLAPGRRVPIISEQTSLPRPKKNSTACQPCKQAKRSGPPSPCKACEGSDSECVFDESLDLRRKVAIRRTITELEESRNYYRNLLNSLLTTLRSSELDKVNNLLNLIRSNASLPDIAAAVEDFSVKPGDPPPADLTSFKASGDVTLQAAEKSFTDSHTQVTLEMLCDMPLFQVPAKPWTTVTDDDHLISHLFSLYFTWDHPFSQLFDQKIFLDEVAKGDLGSELCTPFLVNSLLAVASAYSDFPKVFATPGDKNSRGQHFYMEAERLLKAEEGRATLPNIQGVILMCHAHVDSHRNDNPSLTRS